MASSRRTAVLAFLVLAAGHLFAVPAPGRAVDLRRGAVLAGGGDAFDTYDYQHQVRAEDRVDWPVSLIFYGNATVEKVKAVVAPAMPYEGSVKYAWVRGGWDRDRGVKQYPGDCDSTVNYHMRVYAPPDSGRMYAPKYGYFVVATTHVDHREHCPGQWFGDSEAAEDFVVGLFRERGYATFADRTWLGNAEQLGNIRSDGYASEIAIP